MKNDNYREKVKQLIAQKAGVEPREIGDDMFLGDDLNLGEFEITEILEELDDIFQIDMTGEQENIESVRDLYELLEEKLE